MHRPSVLALILPLLLQHPLSCEAEMQTKLWYIPTRLTARIPCLDKNLLRPGRTMDQEHASAALYRWIQDNGNVIGSGFYQTLRLLQMPNNHEKPFHVVRLVCMQFDWSADAMVMLAHEINFYEAPLVTAAVTASFRFRDNFTNFIKYLDDVDFAKSFCRLNARCVEALVAPVRSLELEYPHLFEQAAAFNRTPLTDLREDLRKGERTGEAPDFLFHVNFVLRLSLSNQLQDLCNPQLHRCNKQLTSDRQAILQQFSEAAARALNSFAEERATLRKLQTPDQSLVELPVDALNFTLRLSSVSLCPLGYGVANLTTMKVENTESRNGTALMCLACEPGTHGPNGLDCLRVPRDFYTEGWGEMELTPCPNYYVTIRAGAKNRQECIYNGTMVEQAIMTLMQHAWVVIEDFFYDLVPRLTSVLLILYIFVSAYMLFSQVHRLVSLLQYRRRRDMSDRLLKRFIAEAYLRDLRRMQYWEAALTANAST